MSEKLFRFLLSELKTIRIICKGCHGIIELPPGKIAHQLAAVQCPLCRVSFGHSENYQLAKLAEAIHELSKPDAPVTVEFLIPDKS